MELESYLKGKTIESVKETENGLEIVFKNEKFEPKDGDFIASTIDNGLTLISIYKSKGTHWSYNAYCNVYSDGTFLDNYTRSLELLWSNRLATESEKQTLLDALAKDGKRWNAEKKQIEKIRWRAEKGESYKFVSSYGEMLFNKEQGLPWDNSNFNIGNYFKIDEDVTPYIEKMKSIFAENL